MSPEEAGYAAACALSTAEQEAAAQSYGDRQKAIVHHCYVLAGAQHAEWLRAYGKQTYPLFAAGFSRRMNEVMGDD